MRVQRGDDGIFFVLGVTSAADTVGVARRGRKMCPYIFVGPIFDLNNNGEHEDYGNTWTKKKRK